MHPDYTIAPARYAKGQLLVRPVRSEHGTKTRAARLLGDGLNCHYSHRENGYIASHSKAKRFQQLYASGWDASYITGKLIPPKEPIPCE